LSALASFFSDGSLSSFSIRLLPPDDSRSCNGSSRRGYGCRSVSFTLGFSIPHARLDRAFCHVVVVVVVVVKQRQRWRGL
jgi:hypothetical protein